MTSAHLVMHLRVSDAADPAASVAIDRIELYGAFPVTSHNLRRDVQVEVLSSSGPDYTTARDRILRAVANEPWYGWTWQFMNPDLRASVERRVQKVHR